MPDPQRWRAPYYPIIYVRGFAMTQKEQDETAADPFCGFNTGSAVYRATPDKNKPAKKFIFESPVLRLISDFDYTDVYDNGLDVLDPDWEGALQPRSILIYRYYDEASSLLGSGKTPPITDFAKGLSDLILRVRELVCKEPRHRIMPKNFKCYLLAHSMGGLVCRAFLQNPALGHAGARACVEKVFTYATPHNGIDLAGVNVPRWLTHGDTHNFNREYMAEYLNLQDLFRKTGRTDWLPESVFPSHRFFCMVGTNRGDYAAAAGLSRTFVGHGSDGLVKIENASVWGVDDRGKFSAPSATAYTYRSHSGFFGIVNSEEAYQNLVRFLFGNVRVDVWLDVESVRLPPAIQGKNVDALYQFEFLASPRGKRWYLTRRMAEEDSVACRRHRDLIDPANKAARTIFLSTVFLDKNARLNKQRASLAYSVTLGVRVPDYEVDQKFWFDSHFEGGYLFRDALTVELTAPEKKGGAWTFAHDWQSDVVGRATTPLPSATKGETRVLTVPFENRGAPGITGNLRFEISAWNR